MRTRVMGAAFGISLLLGALPAHADAIDGTWCREGGLRMMISGSTIVNPAGTKTQGDYSRHAFSYVTPSGDPGAGTAISMLLLNEDTVQLRPGLQARAETWLRCGPPVS
jgi:hypothetical protein